MSTVNKKVYKLFKAKVVSVDEENKTIRYKFSDNKPDRDGEIVDQHSWDFKSYLANPLFLWRHTSDEPEDVLGTGSDLVTEADGSASYFTAQFDTEINPKAELTWKQSAKGTLRCVSAGFIPHSVEYLEDVPVLKDCELLEISLVPIPANPRAVALEYKSGSISKKDATWLLESMRKEANFIEDLMKSKSPDTTKEEQMSPEQAQAVIDGMSKLTEKVDTLTTENQALREQVEALKPAEETDDERTAREAKEADDKAEADKKAADEAEAKRIEDEKAKEDLAKSGDNDQGGAKGTDDLDEDAELTPELQAKIDAELAEAVA